MFKLSIKEILFLSLSSFLTALAVRLFFIEYSLTPGGITGLSITLSSLLQLPIDLISLCISNNFCNSNYPSVSSHSSTDSLSK